METKLLRYDDFCNECKKYFDSIFDEENNFYIMNSHYYCGEGTHTFCFCDYRPGTSDLTIAQIDECKAERFELSSDNYGHNEFTCKFNTLKEVFEYLDKNYKQ